MTDSAVADHAASDRPSRRALLGAGVLGAALVLARSRTASALSDPGLSDVDTNLAGLVIAFELTARDLYDAAIEAGSTDEVFAVLREQHEAYATRIAGEAGLSADARNDDLYDALVDGFSEPDPFLAARDLEDSGAAGHISLLGEIEEVGFAELEAAIAAMESRHSTVLGIIAGESGDALFINPATTVEA